MQPAAPAPTGSEPSAPASFLDSFRAAESARSAPESQAPPVAAPEPVVVPAAAPGGTAPAAPAPVADADAWLKDLPGGFKTREELNQALTGLDELRTNQLTDAQRAVLKLSEDAASFREYNQLVHTDFATLTDEQVLFEAFKKAAPGLGDEDLRVLFEQEMDTKYPGLASGPEESIYKAHAAKLKLDAGRERTSLTQARESRLADLKKGALPAAGPTPEQEQQQRAAYLEGIDKLLDSHQDGYTITVNVDGTPLNLSVEAKDLPAFKEVIANPLGALLSEDKKSLDPQKLMRFAAFQLRGDALLTDALRAGQSSGGPQVSVQELHNATGTPNPPAVGGDGSFGSAFLKAAPQAARPKY